MRRQRPRVDKRAARRRVTQQEAEGSREPDRILHEGRGQGQPARPGFSSLHTHSSIIQARRPDQGALLVSIGCPVMKVRTRLLAAAQTRRDL